MSTIEFNQMLLSNAESLRPFATTLTRDYDSAKDLYQETLFRALANKEKYHVGTNLKAWLYTIMRNIFINDYRKMSRQHTLLDNTPHDFLIEKNQRAAVNAAFSTIQTKEINSAIDALPAIFCQPFRLYLDGYKYHEIAEAMNEPLGTIKSRIHFARKLLKEQVERS